MASKPAPDDPDATFLGGRAEPDPDSTLMAPRGGMPAQPDADATLPPGFQMDADATVLGQAPSKPDADATQLRRPVPPPAAAASDEATLFIPTPGKRRSAAAAPKPAPLPPAPRATDPVEAQLESLVGLNPLVAAANRLLSAVPQIRASLRHSNPGALRDELLSRIAQFKATAKHKGYPTQMINIAAYALAALIDDSAMNTPWAGAVQWEQRGLLQTLEGEAPGSLGDQFFKLLNDAEESPAANIELLEFFAVCLSLGYEGRFRKANGGRAQLEQIWVRLYGLVCDQRGNAHKELSARWKGVDAPLRTRSLWFGTGVTASVCAAVLVTAYLALRVMLASDSEPASRSLAALRAKVPEISAASAERLRPYLAKEIESGLLTVKEDAMKSVIVLSGDELFPTGTDVLDAGHIPTVLRVAQALNKVPGTITIAGHTDDKSVRSARFPSNWELSRDRAMTVMKTMAGEIADPGRLRAEGLADSEPLTPNESDGARAKNRRITAVLRVAP